MITIKKVITLSLPLFLILAIFGATYLTQSSNDLRSKAAHPPDPDVTEGPTAIIPTKDPSTDNPTDIPKPLPDSTITIVTQTYVTPEDLAALINNSNTMASMYSGLSIAKIVVVNDAKTINSLYKSGNDYYDPSTHTIYMSYNTPAGFDPTSGAPLVYKDDLDNPKKISHEFAHDIGLHNLSLMENYNKTFGWENPDPNGTGLTNNTPGPHNLNSAEEFADYSSQFTDPLEREKLKNENPKMHDWLEKNVFANIKSYFINAINFIKAFVKLETVLAQNPTIANNKFDLLIPGQTTIDEAQNLLGSPTQTFSNTEKTIYWYKTADNLYFDTIIFKQGKVYLTTHHNSNLNWGVITDFGTPDKMTYNMFRYDSITYIYSNKGLALTADLNGNILVKQKFIPKPVQEFVSEWPGEYPEISVLIPTVPKIKAEALPTTNPNFSPTVIPAACSQKLTGDANCDGSITGLDYIVYLHTSCNPEGAQVCTDIRADFDGDNKVNLSDYKIWKDNTR